MTSHNLTNLDFDRDIVPLISNALLESGYFRLSDKEVIVLRGAWLGWSYKDMAKESGHSIGHLERHVAKELFERLSDLMGENIQKNTLHKVIAALSEAKQQSQRPDALLEMQKIVGTLPICNYFVDRNEPLTDLTKHIQANRVVCVTGVAGIGKTSLISSLFSQPEYLSTFQGLIWKYSISSNPQENILDLQRILQIPKNSTIFDFINDRKVLICIDGIDDWFKDESNAKEAYSFLRRLIEAQHNSCFIFTLREPISLLGTLQSSGRPVQTYELIGLSKEESALLLSKYNLKGKNSPKLIASSMGNPQNLNESAQCIEKLYGGNIDLFLEGKTSLVLNVIKKNLSFIFSHLQEIGDKERSILAYIASEAQDRSVSENDIIKHLRKQFGYSIPYIVKILNILKSFNLVVSEDSSGSTITVPSFVAKYIQLNPDQFPDLVML